MPTEKNNKSLQILVAPLDWGLGHATRCIPLVRSLLQDGNQVFLAGSGPSGHLLRTEFPQLPYTEIPTHTIKYARSRTGFRWTILQQIPALWRQIQAEKKWLHNFLLQHPIDQVISDNRYGLHHSSTHNILLTHQLGLKSGVSPIVDRVLQSMLIRLLKNFQEVWVPDQADEPTLSGELGHPTYTPPVPVHYIGPLTRFTPTNQATISNKITIVLSGPEPQRTLLEEKCMRELNEWKGDVTLIRGLPVGGKRIDTQAHWQVFDHLPVAALQQQIEEAEWVIARCGYSTLMDLHVLSKKAILIPTPGQPEQEYLAHWLPDKSQWHCLDQKADLLATLSRTPLQKINGNFTKR